MSNILSRRLKSARETAKLSQVDLGAAAGVSQSFIAQVERGEKSPSTEVLRALAQALNTSITWLLGEGIRELKDHYANDPRLSILNDALVAPGLRGLAEDEPMCHVLEVSSDEWESLRSIAIKVPPGKDGYLLLLHTLRAVQSGA